MTYLVDIGIESSHTFNLVAKDACAPARTNVIIIHAETDASPRAEIHDSFRIENLCYNV